MSKNNRFGKSAVLSPGEYSKIRKQLTSNHHRLLWDIAYYTGERWGAIVQLEVGDVYQDPRARVPHSEITFRARTRKASPDGRRHTRQIPIHHSLGDILRMYAPPVEGWLFPAPRSPGLHIPLDTADAALRRAVDRAGLGHKGISTHSTRRSFITGLAERGVALHTIQSLTGHKDTKVLMGYIEQGPETLRKAIDSF